LSHSEGIRESIGGSSCSSGSSSGSCASVSASFFVGPQLRHLRGCSRPTTWRSWPFFAFALAGVSLGNHLQPCFLAPSFAGSGRLAGDGDNYCSRVAVGVAGRRVHGRSTRGGKSADETLQAPLVASADALKSFLEYAERQLQSDIKQQEEFKKSTVEAGSKYNRLRSATVRRTRKLRETAYEMAAAADAIAKLAALPSPDRARDIGRVLQKLSRKVGRYQAVFDRTEEIYREVCTDVDGLLKQAGQRVSKMEKEQRTQAELAKLAGFIGIVCLPIAVIAEAPVLAALSVGGGTMAAAMQESAKKYGDLSGYYRQVQQALVMVLERIRDEKDGLGNVKESLDDTSAELEEARLDVEEEEWSSLVTSVASLTRAFTNVVADCDDYLGGFATEQNLLEA